MNPIPLMLISLMSLLSSCAPTQSCARSLTASAPEAQALVAASQTAHGGAAFDRLRDLSVRYEGRWASIGPRFKPSGTVFAMNGTSVVDQSLCDEVLAVLRPGLEMAEEDRMILHIDRGSKRLRRVRLILNGLDSTRGAEVDVTFRDFKHVDGVLWPTDFDERIRSPFKLHAHHWTLRGFDNNCGLSAHDLNLSQWTNKATTPSAALHL
jgi:hypothetical protein